MLLVRDLALPRGAPRVVRSRTAWGLVRDLLAEVGIGGPLDVVRTCRRCGAPDHGKPEVLGALTQGWHVSVSTTDGLVAAVVCDEGPVGVDVEQVSAVGAWPVTEVLLHPAEHRVLGPRPSAHDLAVVWTRKEALLKATGDGLSVEPATLLLTPPDRPPAVVDDARSPCDVPPGTVLRDLADLPDGYVGCVARLGRRD